MFIDSLLLGEPDACSGDIVFFFGDVGVPTDDTESAWTLLPPSLRNVVSSDGRLFCRERVVSGCQPPKTSPSVLVASLRSSRRAFDLKSANDFLDIGDEDGLDCPEAEGSVS